MKRIAIIGGGISGLSAAYELERQRQSGTDLEYTIIESAERLGGVLVSECVDGCLIEAGPDSFITEKPWALNLCRELGLEDQIIGSNDAQRRTFILVKGRLVEMPDGLMFLVPTKILPTVFTPLFSWPTKLRMAMELFHKPQPLSLDESVADFIKRHFGAGAIDRLADPLLSGIHGAGSDHLSVRAVLPRFVEMQQKHGSLIKGMLAARRRMAEMSKGKPKPPLFSSLKDGMQQLVDTLLARLDPRAMHLNVQVQDVRLSDGHWQVIVEGLRETFDAVVIATPAHVAGALLQQADEELAAELSDVSYSSSVTVTLVYERSALAGCDRGFGILVPRSERHRMRACTFVHNKFPHRAPENRGIVRVFLGGLGDEEAVLLADEEILSTVTGELRAIAGISAAPLATRIYRWDRAMSQPTPGHLDRIAWIDERLQTLPGLALAGNYFRGVGVPDCIRRGREAGKRVASELVVSSS